MQEVNLIPGYAILVKGFGWHFLFWIMAEMSRLCKVATAPPYAPSAPQSTNEGTRQGFKHGAEHRHSSRERIRSSDCVCNSLPMKMCDEVATRALFKMTEKVI